MSARSRLRFASICFSVVIAVLTTRSAHAYCSSSNLPRPVVTFTASGPAANGQVTLTITWHFAENGGGTVGINEPGSSLWHTDTSAPQDGTQTITVDKHCMTVGPHDFWGSAEGCGGYTETHASVTVPPNPPSIHLSLSGPDTNGTMSVTYTWNFPETVAPGERYLVISTNGSWVPVYDYDGVPTQSGTATYSWNASCSATGTYTHTAVARSCRGDSATDSVTYSVDATPHVSLTPNGPDANGFASFNVSWDFP